MSTDAALIARLAPVTLVVGKGGVGKTTVAAALATRFAEENLRTLVVTTDPAGTLLTALDQPLVRTTQPIPVGPNLEAWAFDTAAIRDEFLARWREPISTILDRGTYLDTEDIAGLVDAALPGADEIFAVLTLGDVLAQTENAYDRVVIDTAPTGHTLRLLTLPRSFDALVRLLDSMQEKHRFMVRALTHRYKSDAADALIAELRERVDNLQRILTDPKRCAAILVTRPEPVVIAETQRYAAALELVGISVAATIVNAYEAGSKYPASTPANQTFAVPPTTDPVRNLLPSLQPLSGSQQSGSFNPPPRASATSPRTSAVEPISARPFAVTPSILIVGGKGGVGKTTTSIALAIQSADSNRRTLLVSTDPAPSIADALGMFIGDEETEVLPNLAARQIDATHAFSAFRDEYQGRIDQLFEGLAGRGVDIAHDREILRDLLALAPPGIDELYALTVLGEELEEGRFDSIVIDPAPTGHLLRLLDMPKLAVAWAHQLMRMMLKYKDVVGLGDAAQELLNFAKRTRALDERLRDPARSAAVIVALDEPLVREETLRLSRELSVRELPATAIIWNRASSDTKPLPTETGILQLFAPTATPSPIGVDEIRQWANDWRRLEGGGRRAEGGGRRE